MKTTHWYFIQYTTNIWIMKTTYWYFIQCTNTYTYNQHLDNENLHIDISSNVRIFKTNTGIMKTTYWYFIQCTNI